MFLAWGKQSLVPKLKRGDILAMPVHKVAGVEEAIDAAVSSRLAELGFEIVPREQQTPEALGALQKACREMVADHQGAWDQWGEPKQSQ